MQALGIGARLDPSADSSQRYAHHRKCAQPRDRRHGARDASHRQSLIAALDLFQSVPLPEAIWDVVGQNLASLRASSVTVPFTDAVIATVAASNGIALWTRDKHFKRIQQVLPVLAPFEGSV